MKKKVKTFVAIISIISVLFSLTACSGLSSLDVVGKESVNSFDAILETVSDNVTADEENAGWSLEAPDKSARFIWSEDYSKSALSDVMLEFDAEPFVNAGLDPDKLPENYTYYNGMLTVGTKLGKEQLTYQDAPTPLTAYEQIVRNYRDTISYHSELDHYGIKLGDGNMFEWAKDMSVNDTTNENQELDIVFVLNPEPLITSGVDIEQLEGWSYAPVEVMGEQVYKFLKPFDLK